MIKRRYAMFLIAVTLLLLLGLPAVTPAADENVASEGSPVSRAVDDIDVVPERMVESDETEEEPSSEVHSLAGVFAGYRFLEVNGYGGRAAPFEYLHSSAVGGLSYNSLSRNQKYVLEGTFLNDNDYHGDLVYDYKGTYRLHLRTEALFHNLDHETAGTSFNFFNDKGQPAVYTVTDVDPMGRYGVKVEQDQAQFRYKLHDYPLHLNLGYWRITKEGTRQLRFADQTFEATQNTMLLTSRPINRETHEATAGLDAHLGPVDFVYTFLIRQFVDKNAIPLDTFVTRPGISAALLQHNEDPESRYIAHTVKLHTSLDGGITGGASYTFGRRENRSQLSDFSGSDRTATNLHNAAGDFTYIPNDMVTFALKYRRQEIDPSTPSTIINTTLSSATQVPVRPAFATTRDIMTATLSIRPDKIVTLKGDYKAEFVHRDLLQNSDETLNWRGLPENSLTQRGTIAILSRPVKGLRLKAQYGYTATDHPAYGTTPSKRNEGDFLATYTRANAWGMTASYRAVRDTNDEIHRSEIQILPTTVTYIPLTNPLSRDQSTDNVTTSVWFAPFAPLTLSGSYGFMRSSVDQGILFTIINPNSIQDVANYTNQAHYYALNGVYRFDEKISVAVGLQQVRSFAEFEPRLLTTATSDTSGLTEISHVKAVDSSLSVRADYRVTALVTCALDYSYRKFDEKSSTALDGTVQVVMATLAARW